MTPQEFAQTIKTKYPQYKDVDDIELAKKIVAKYPSYSDKVNFGTVSRPAIGEDGTIIGGMAGKFLGGLGERFKERGENVIEQSQDIQKGVDLAAPEAGGTRALAAGAGALKLAGRTAGQVAGGVGDIFFEALKAVTPDELEQKISTKLSEVVGSEKVRPVVDSIYNLAKNHPEAAKDVETLVNVLTLRGGSLAGKPVKELVEGGVKKAGQLVLDAGEVASRTASRLGGVVDDARLFGIGQAKKNVDQVVGEIIQGKTKDIPKAMRALADIDTTGVKTYAELGDKIDDQVEALSRKMDEFLNETPEPLKADQLVTTTKVGETVVT